MEEIDVIQLFYPDSAASLLDDCAEIPGPTGAVGLVTTDSMTEGTHFRLDWSSPQDLALKLLHSNLSDLAGSGASADWALLTLGIPPHVSREFLAAFAATFTAEARRFGVRVIGGDSFKSAKLDLGMTLAGTTTRHLRRSGGCRGDTLYVTGELGLSLAGYRVLSGLLDLPADLKAKACERHLRPQARPKWGLALALNERIHASMDVSDGIVDDAPRMADASCLSLEIDLDVMPLSDGLAPWMSSEEAAGSGEEYELLFLGEPGLEFPFPVSAIGRAVAQGPSPVTFFRSGKAVSVPKGYRHFS